LLLIHFDYFKHDTLYILQGVAHGLMFLPVVLSYIGPMPKEVNVQNDLTLRDSSDLEVEELDSNSDEDSDEEEKPKISTNQSRNNTNAQIRNVEKYTRNGQSSGRSYGEPPKSRAHYSTTSFPPPVEEEPNAVASTAIEVIPKRRGRTAHQRHSNGNNNRRPARSPSPTQSDGVDITKMMGLNQSDTNSDLDELSGYGNMDSFRNSSINSESFMNHMNDGSFYSNSNVENGRRR